ncbi:MAG TPA: VOC family protein, partial [Pseudomonadales bacterium]|nr:VOC family protein [Pseudomonadales bacterium]
SNEDVDAVAKFVVEHGARIVHGPQLDPWAPGYYSVLFEDPCGTRLEVNHVPGKGHLGANANPPLGGDVQKQLSEP